MPPNTKGLRIQPAIPVDKVQQIETLAQPGNLSDQQIATAVGVSRKTARRYMDAARAAGRLPPLGPSATGVTARVTLQNAPAGPAGSPTGSPTGADFLVSVPRAFQMDTRIVFQAMEAAQKEWRWDLRRLTPGDFIDTVVFLYFRDRRIILSSYVKLAEGDRLVLPEQIGPRRAEPAGPNGAQNGGQNGAKNAAELEEELFGPEAAEEAEEVAT